MAQEKSFLGGCILEVFSSIFGAAVVIAPIYYLSIFLYGFYAEREAAGIVQILYGIHEATIDKVFSTTFFGDKKLNRTMCARVKLTHIRGIE